MKRGATNNVSNGTYCPVQLKHMLQFFKQRKPGLNRVVMEHPASKEPTTGAKNIFTLKCENDSSVEFQLKTY